MRPASLFKAGIAALLLAGCLSTPHRGFHPTAAEEQLVDLMSKRLVLAREVGWFKYRNQLPVHDPRREAELLQSLAGSSGSEFVSAQIVASRKLQEAQIRKWSRGARLPAMEPRPLVPTIRGDIETVTAEMVALLPEARRSDALSAFAYRRLRSERIPAFVASTASRPLAD